MAIDAHDLFVASDMFRNVDPRVREHLAGQAVRRRYLAQQRIYAAGEAALGVYGVLSGYVVLDVTDQWKEHLCVGAPKDGEWFGDTDLWGPKRRACDAWALCDTELALIDRRAFLAAADREPQLMRNMLDRCAVRMHCARQVFYESVFLPVGVRIARHLVRMADSEILDPSKPDAVFTLSQEAFGLIAGTTRKSVNKFLSEWRAQGWVEVRHRSIRVLDRKALHGFAFGDEPDPIGDLWRQFLRPAALTTAPPSSTAGSGRGVE